MHSEANHNNQPPSILRDMVTKGLSRTGHLLSSTGKLQESVHWEGAGNASLKCSVNHSVDDLVNHPVDGLGPVSMNSAASGSVSQGLSGAKIWRCEANGQSFALRRWPSEGMTPERLAWIHHSLAIAKQNGCELVPTPIELEPGETFVAVSTSENPGNSLWELTPWMPGAPLSDTSSFDDQILAIKALSQFHFATNESKIDKGTSPSIQKRIAFLQANPLPRCVDLSAVGVGDSPAQQLACVLQEAKDESLRGLLNWKTVRLPLQPVQIDSRHEHFLLTHNRVTGIIDFGAMQLDTPTVDLARLIGEITADPISGKRERQQELFRYYASPHADLLDFDLISLLDQSGAIAGIINWVAWLGKLSSSSQNLDLRGRGLLRLRTLAKRLGVVI